MGPENIAMRTYVASLLEKNLREGSRGFMEYRKIDVEANPFSQPNGSARVKIGETEVVAGVKFEVGTPFPDTPDEGVLITTMELSPIASEEFEPGPPSSESIELARVVDRALRESKMIDMGKLCIEPREQVWMVYVDIYVINDDGNLFDASFIAAVTALKNAVLPKYDKKEKKVDHMDRTKETLPIDEKKVPFLITFSKINGYMFVDANTKERSVEDCRLSIAMIGDNLCAMQKGGEGPISEAEVLKLIDEAADLSKKLKKQLKW